LLPRPDNIVGTPRSLLFVKHAIWGDCDAPAPEAPRCRSRRRSSSQLAPDGRRGAAQGLRVLLLLGAREAQLRYGISILQRKMLGHRRDSVPKRKFETPPMETCEGVCHQITFRSPNPRAKLRLRLETAKGQYYKEALMQTVTNPDVDRGAEVETAAPRLQFGIRACLKLICLVAALLGIVRLMRSAYWTDGYDAYLFAAFAFPLVAVCCVFLLRGNLRIARWAVGAACVLYMAFAVCQAAVERRLRMLEAEVVRVVNYVEQYRRSNGRYPADVDLFEYERPEYRSLIRYWPPAAEGEGYVIHFDLFVGESLNREYGRSGWYFYPD
jgi:hypothetical protein